MRLIVTDVTKHLIRIFNNRRTLVRAHRRDTLAHIRNKVRVCDNHFLCFRTAKIFKFFEHLFRCTKVKRCLVIRIFKSLSGHNNSAVDLIIRIQKMHITRCNDRFMKFFAKTHDLLVDLNEIVIGCDRRFLISDQERIISKGLYFQIIIEIHQS